MQEAMIEIVLLSVCGAEVPGGSILSSTDERLRYGFDSLMAQVPFWLAGQGPVVQQLATVLQQLQVMPVWECSNPWLLHHPGPYPGTIMLLAASKLHAHDFMPPAHPVQPSQVSDLVLVCTAATHITSLLPASFHYIPPLMLPLQSADSAAAYSQALVTLEAAMSSSSLDPHGPLDGDWHKTWQQQWRDSLQRCQPPSWEAMALHLSMVGRHVVPRPFKMSRDAFLRAVEGSR